MVRWTISSDERRELRRAAGPASRAFDAQIDRRATLSLATDRFARAATLTLGAAGRVSHLKNQWVERRYRSANPMIFLPFPQGERKTAGCGEHGLSYRLARVAGEDVVGEGLWAETPPRKIFATLRFFDPPSRGGLVNQFSCMSLIRILEIGILFFTNSGSLVLSLKRHRSRNTQVGHKGLRATQV